MANNNQDSVTRNEIVKDLSLFWAKLDKPVEPFGEAQWEIQVRFPKKRTKEMEQYGKVKETDEAGIFSVNLRKKALKKDGSPAMKVKLVDTKGNELEAKYLGNGSKGNVKLMLRDWIQRGPKGNILKQGTNISVVAVQVTELIKYEPKGGADFDYDSDEDDTPPKNNKKPVGKRPADDDMDDDIPF